MLQHGNNAQCTFDTFPPKFVLYFDGLFQPLNTQEVGCDFETRTEISHLSCDQQEGILTSMYTYLVRSTCRNEYCIANVLLELKDFDLVS